MTRSPFWLHVVLFASVVASAFWNVFSYAAHTDHYRNAVIVVALTIACSALVFAVFIAWLKMQYRKSGCEARFSRHELFVLLGIVPYWIFRLAVGSLVPAVKSGWFFAVYFALMNVAAPITMHVIARQARAS